jgi:2-polyprenyl-3-methyl-5-hydroxy-6-metoxy-1,4-benzoquinol methylase
MSTQDKQTSKHTDFVNISNCLACGSRKVSPYLDLGLQPLANDFTETNAIMEVFPLVLQYCEDCFHSQLSVSVSPERLFRNYLYVSSTTETLMEYFRWFVEDVVSGFGDSLNVLEIASNDGSLLKILAERGYKAIGVDPALNLLPHVMKNGVVSICDFWPGIASNFLQNSSDIVIAMNVIAHVPDPCEFLSAARKALKPDGRIVLQTSQAEMIEKFQFDTVYHEHLSFFNVSSMEKLAERSGLSLIDVVLVPIHGQSYIWTLKASNSGSSDRLKLRREYERQAGLKNQSTYSNFARMAKEIAGETLKKILELQSKGYSVWGYGAAAKGNTFLNFADIKLSGFFDDNPLKQGRQSPGGCAIVFHPEKMTDINEPICFIVPAWNFAEEIAQRILRLRIDERDRILLYYPSLQLVTVAEMAQSH